MKPTNLVHSLIPLATLAGTMIVPAQTTQVGDLRLDADAFSGAKIYLDPGWDNLTTRSVSGAPVQLTSLFSGTSSDSHPPGAGDGATDPGIQTFFDYTEFKNLNRYGLDDDGPLGEVDTNGADRIGMLQYEIDLTPIEGYLTQSGETLTTLSLDLEFLLSDSAKTYDIYLSYTNAGEGITETPIAADDPGANYTDFWLPSRTNPEGDVVIAAVGDVINGTHKILNINQLGNLSQSTDLLPLYTAGVRKVNVIIAVGSFYSGRLLSVEDLAGIFMGTDALATEQVGDLRLSEDLYPVLVHEDQFGPVETRPVPDATLDVPSIVTVTSQNQGGNPPPRENAGQYGLDGKAGGTNTFNGTGATVTGFGLAGIGATASDQYQYTAWQKSGDFTVDVQLDSLTSLQAGARAGLMIRGSLDADAAHVFVGIQQFGEPVVVIRDVAGNVSTEMIGVAPLVAFPQKLRVIRVGDEFSFFITEDGETFEPASPAFGTVVLPDPVYVGMAATSGSDMDGEDAVAVFTGLSATLPNKGKDIALETTVETTEITCLNRYANSENAGAAQWSIDLTPLDDYLTNNSLTLDSLSLKLITEMSANNLDKEYDVYLSYTDPGVPISLINISKTTAALNKLDLWDPAVGAFVGDVINDTHEVLWANAIGNINVSEDLLALYNAGVRDVNLIIVSKSYNLNRAIGIVDGSGLFIETSGGAAPEVVVTGVSRNGNVLSLTVDGLTNGNSYHLGGSVDMLSFPSISGTTVVATGAGDVLSATILDAAHYVRVLEGAAP